MVYEGLARRPLGDSQRDAKCVDVVDAYLSAGSLGGFALVVLGLGLCHSVCRPYKHKKDRHDGRPIIYNNNVEKHRARTETDDVGTGDSLYSIKAYYKEPKYHLSHSVQTLVGRPLCFPCLRKRLSVELSCQFQLICDRP